MFKNVHIQIVNENTEHRQILLHVGDGMQTVEYAELVYPVNSPREVMLRIDGDKEPLIHAPPENVLIFKDGQMCSLKEILDYVPDLTSKTQTGAALTDAFRNLLVDGYEWRKLAVLQQQLKLPDCEDTDTPANIQAEEAKWRRVINRSAWQFPLPSEEDIEKRNAAYCETEARIAMIAHKKTGGATAAHAALVSALRSESLAPGKDAYAPKASELPPLPKFKNTEGWSTSPIVRQYAEALFDREIEHTEDKKFIHYKQHGVVGGKQVVITVRVAK